MKLLPYFVSGAPAAAVTEVPPADHPAVGVQPVLRPVLVLGEPATAGLNLFKNMIISVRGSQAHSESQKLLQKVQKAPPHLWLKNLPATLSLSLAAAPLASHSASCRRNPAHQE